MNPRFQQGRPMICLLMYWAFILVNPDDVYA